MQHLAAQSRLTAIPAWVLGTSALVGSPTAHTSSLALRCHNDVFVFDCGDDTQRQLMRIASSKANLSIKFVKITRIFITALDSSRTHGLPGFLCTLVRILAAAA